jgi:hypothetical protein
MDLPSLNLAQKALAEFPIQGHNPIFPLLLPRTKRLFARGARPATSGTINLASSPSVFASATSRRVNAVLLDLSAAALNENEQHDGEKQSGNNPDNCGLIHFESPLL